MMTTFRAVVISLAVLALTACAGQELKKVQGMSPKGSAFTQALYGEYIELAQLEYGEGHYAAADDHALRASSSAAGKAPTPYDPKNFKLPKGKVAVITGAHQRLLRALNGGGPEKAPRDMARAQAMFDCWVEEQEENIQPKDIARCRDGFYDAIAKVEAALKPMAKAMATPKMPGQQDFIVYFDFNRANLSAEAMSMIAKASAFAKSTKSLLKLRGHTDRSGSEEYNMGLSEERNESVILEMLNKNVEARIIRSTALGESEPAVPTPDGQRHPKNRRVEISVVPSK